MMNTEPTSIKYYIISWIFSALAFLLASKLFKGFEVSGFFAALFAAMLLGFANTFIWPILIFLTLPFNIITLGLFTFVVNGAVLKLVAAVLPGFQLKGWLSAIFGAVFISIITTIFQYFLVPFFTHSQPI